MAWFLEFPILIYILSVWGQLIFMLGLEIEACKPLQNDLKNVSIIEMIFLHDGQYSIVLLTPKNEVKLSHKSLPKCRQVDLYGEMACARFRDFIS